jgi:hypothetical protein
MSGKPKGDGPASKGDGPAWWLREGEGGGGGGSVNENGEWVRGGVGRGGGGGGGGGVVNDERHKFSKVCTSVTLYGTFSRVLTFENIQQAQSGWYRFGSV